LFLYCAALAWADAEPLSPAELEDLSGLEKLQPVLDRTAGDYSPTIHVLSSVMQYTFLLFPPLLVGLLIPRVHRSFVRARHGMLAMTQEAEGRQFRRILTNPELAMVTVSDPATGETLLETGLLDLSVGGICMAQPAENEPEYDRRYVVRIRVEDDSTLALTDIAATVAWKRSGRVGMRFDKLLRFSHVLLAEVFAKREPRIDTDPDRTFARLLDAESRPLYQAGLLNINKGGICLLEKEPCPVAEGVPCLLEISHSRRQPVVLSGLSGTVVWRRDGRLGMQFGGALHLSPALLSKMFAMKQTEKASDQA
jgi:hypothetical protein